jgi:hypothetical protein
VQKHLLRSAYTDQLEQLDTKAILEQAPKCTPAIREDDLDRMGYEAPPDRNTFTTSLARDGKVCTSRPRKATRVDCYRTSRER